MGASIESGRGYFQRVRIKFKDEPVYIIYDRLLGDHFSLDGRTTRLVQRYIKMQHAKEEKE